MKTGKAVGVIIPAAGAGSRFGGTRPKQFLPLAGIPVLIHSLRFFSRQPEVSQIVVALPPSAAKGFSAWTRRFSLPEGGICWLQGGESRQASVANAFAGMAAQCQWVAVHDAARPLLDRPLFLSLLRRAGETGAAIPGLPLTDTLKRRQPGSDLIAETIPRECIAAVQTPQVFRRTVLEEALQKAESEGFQGTDEASLVERLGRPVAVVPGSRRNLKITVPSDMVWARWLLAHPRWK